MFGTERDDLPWSREAKLIANALDGRKAVVVGGTNGIGLALAQHLHAHGADVVVVGRKFQDTEGPRMHFVQADLSSLKKAREVAQGLDAEALDMLVMTTGIFAGDPRQESSEGIELDMAVSCLSRLVILREIGGRLGSARPKGSPKPRVFVMGFPGGEKTATLDDLNSETSYKWTVAHANTVVCNEAFVLDGAKRYPALNLYGLNPGIIKSNIMAGALGENSWSLFMQQSVMGVIMQSADAYAATIVPLMISLDIEQHSGSMFGRYGDAIHSNPWLDDFANVERTIAESEKLLARGLAVTENIGDAT